MDSVGSVKEKLDYILETKENIKQAIKDTGIEVPEDLSFREYGSKIQEVIDTTIIPQFTLDGFVEFTNTINGSKEVN